MQATALYSCTPDEIDELAFQKGDLLIDASRYIRVVVETAEGWLTATLKRTGQRGLVPANYIKLEAIVSKPLAPPSLPTRTKPVTSNEPFFITLTDYEKYLNTFKKEDTDKDGFLMPAQVKQVYQMSGEPKETLAKVWALVDITADGKLSAAEFITGMWLIKEKMLNAAFQLPETLAPEIKEWISNYGSGGEASAVMVSPNLSQSRGPTAATSTFSSPQISNRSPKAETSNKDAAASSNISKIDMLKFSRTNEGKELASTTSDFAKSDIGKKTAGMAWENKESISQAAQSEAGKKAISSAWEHRQSVANAASSGMKLAMKANGGK